MDKIFLNDEWFFTEEYSDSLNNMEFDLSLLNKVRLPHTSKLLPFHYFDESIYQMISGYRRLIKAPKDWEDKRIILTFEGVAHKAEVFLNGEKLGYHNTGYTAFKLELTNKLKLGEDNILVVKVDSRESLNTPPFGFVIDYMTYGGIYRECYLEIKPKTFIEDVFSKAIFDNSLKACELADAMLESRLLINGPIDKELKIMQCLFDGDKKLNELVSKLDNKEITKKHSLKGVKLWSLDKPNRYRLVTSLIENENVIDIKEQMIGMKKACFEEDGFYLNDKKVKLRGLNRHQSYAYVGYAMPESMQRYDAKLLKEELGCNAVRTSHYPQSKYFYDECDRLGILVFTEIPGWQHIGDKEWKEQACENVKEMIVQYRNHPSIILWGVRINESKDDDAFYKKTNEIAHMLDDSRQTGGVRCIKNSHLFEDVYTYNDFVHDGSSPGCMPKKKVTSNMKKGYLVSEYNGHMYPTKAYDCEEHRVEHLLRHARVLDSIAGNEDIAGSFGWCMFDYNTHKDFGSGDRICYHGVMDMFRNPKLAALIYKMQDDKEVVLELSSTMDIGEHPGCVRGQVYILSNADSVKMYKNGQFIKEYFPKDSTFKNLKYGPIAIDDYIGDAIKKGESFSKGQEKILKEILNTAAAYGFNMTPKLAVKALKAKALYHMNMDDAAVLYNKYIGDWGGESTIYKFEAIKDGKVVKTIVKCPAKEKRLEAKASSYQLIEGNTYDVAEIRIKMKDENDNLLYFYNDPIKISLEGPIELIGPDIINLQGGMTGLYVKTKKESGKARVRVLTVLGEKAVVDLDIKEAK